jgi:hypothetical protein
MCDREVQLTPEAKAAEDEWKGKHGPSCPCSQCMWVKSQWVEWLDKSQQECERLENERDNWIETAIQYGKNVEFWRDIVHKIGNLFGKAARTADDGTVMEDVLGLKVFPLVRELYEAANDEVREEKRVARLQNIIDRADRRDAKELARVICEVYDKPAVCHHGEPIIGLYECGLCVQELLEEGLT